jgi:hypothetical protein
MGGRALWPGPRPPSRLAIRHARRADPRRTSTALASPLDRIGRIPLGALGEARSPGREALRKLPLSIGAAIV